mgnify:FL=1
MSTKRPWLIHPAIYGTAARVEAVDLSPFAEVALIQPRVFTPGSSVLDYSLTEAEVQALTETAVTASGYISSRLGYWDWEAAGNAGWLNSDMIECDDGVIAGAPLFTIGKYNLPRDNMYLYAETAGGDPTWPITQTLNDGYADVIANGPAICMPDFYWLYSTNANCQKIVSFNLTEVRRSLTNAGVPNNRIVPFVTWTRPNPTWGTPITLEAESFGSVAVSLLVEGINEFIFWANLSTDQQVEDLNAAIPDYARAMRNRMIAVYEAIAGDNAYYTEPRIGLV